MNKILTILVMGLMTFVPNNTNAQVPTFTFDPAEITAAVGTSISVDFRVSAGFENIVGLQFSNSWDASALQYDGATNVIGTPANPSTEVFNYILNNPTGTNTLINSWNHPTVMPIDLDPGTLLYTLNFTVLTTGGNDINVICGEAPSLCEVTYTDENGVVQEPIEGQLPIAQITAVNGGSSAGGNGELIVNASEECANTGTNVCFDITVNDFDDLQGVQYSTHWDKDVLQFTNIAIGTGVNNPMAIAEANFGTSLTGEGTLTFSWNETILGEGLTLPNGTLIYQLCYNVVGAGGETTAITFDGDPLSIEITREGGMGENVGLISNQGDFLVKGNTGPIASMTVEAGSATVDNGDNVCIPVNVLDGFDGILGFQWTLTYDPAVLSYTGSANINTAIQTLSINEPTSGTLIFTWNDGGGVPQTLADNTALFELCFDGVGNAPDESALAFSNIPTSIEGISEDKDDDGNPDLVAIATNDGSVSISNTGGFNLMYCEADACVDDAEICIPITTTGFDIILGMQWTMEYDDTVLDFTAVKNVNQNLMMAGLFPTAFNEPANNTGHINFAWFSAVGPVSLEDYELLWEVCFSIEGASGSSTVLDITGDPVSIEITQNNPTNPAFPNIIPAFITPNTISINCTAGEQVVTCPNGSTPLEIDVDATTVTDITCPGETDGAITLVTIGGVEPLTYSWSSGDETKDITSLEQASYTIVVTDAEGASATETFTINEPAAFEAGLVATNETSLGANDGTVTLTPTGGTADFTYLWSNGETTANLTGLAPGTYTCDVTDANDCVYNITAMIGSPIEISSSTAVTDIACFGETTGSIDLIFNGGMPPFTFSWDNSTTDEDLSAVAAGDYCVTITDSNNDTAEACYTISQPDAGLGITESVTDETVVGSQDGAIDVTVTGGTTDYSYAWTGPNNFNASSADLTGLAAGFYNLVVTDANDCDLNRTYEIVALGEALSIDVGNSPTTSVDCFGAFTGSIDLNVSGGMTPYTFEWSGPNGFMSSSKLITGLETGPYMATVTDAVGSVAISSSIFVGQPAAPVAIGGTVVPESSIGASDGSISTNVTGGTPGYSYSWSNGAGTANITGLPAGTYTLTVTDARGCSENNSFTITAAGLAFTSSNVANVLCFDECTGAINVSVGGGSAPYTYAWTGQDNFIANTQNINGICAGAYSVVVTDANGNSLTSQVFFVNQPASALEATADITPELLPGTNDGAIDVTVTGGQGPYDFNWSNTDLTEDISGLTSAPYTVTVTDANGCTMIETFVVAPLGPPLVIDGTNSVVTDPSCNGDANGSIDLMVLGGLPPYTFNWDIPSTITEDVTGLFAGSYTVTVTDSFGNTAEQTFILNQPTDLNLVVNNISQETSAGFDGAINITVSGGTPPYIYTWTGPNGFTSQNDDLTNLEEGVYQLTVIDSRGCNLNRTMALGAILRIDNVVVTDVDCKGENTGAINLTIAGGEPPYLYNWNGPGSFVEATRNINDLEAGTYTVIVTDNIGQIVTDEFTVEEPLNNMVVEDVTIVKQTGPNGRGSINIEIAGGTLPYTFVWSNGTTNEDLLNVLEGDYKVTVTDGNGCILVSPNYTVEYCSLPLNLMPEVRTHTSCAGECDGSIFVEINGGDPPYSIEWSNGFTQSLNTRDPSTSLSDLCAGTYEITVTEATGQTVTRSYTIDEPLLLIVNGQVQKEVNGGDGAIDVTVSGGTAPYSFLWNNGMMTEDLSNLSAGNYILTVTDANDCQQVEEFVVGLDALGISINLIDKVDVTCEGDETGSISLSVTGGIQPYTYAWSNGQIDVLSIGELGEGSYSFTVTDAVGTSEIATYQIITLSRLSGVGEVIQNATTFGFNNGEAQVLPEGNQPPYTFLWSNGQSTQIATELGAGLITCTITDALGCEFVVDTDVFGNAFEITQPDEELLMINTINVFEDIQCYGDCNGSLMAEPSGGVVPYTFIWDNENWNEPRFTSMINDLCAGEYFLTVTDAAGNSLTAIQEVIEPGLLELNFNVTPESAPLTGNASAEVVATGGCGNYTYQWNNSTAHTEALCENLTAGTYFVVVADKNQCTAVDSVYVPVVGTPAPCLLARNIITPDGDGLNDNFMIPCALDYDNTLEIFNRWGQLVYEADNYASQWIGTNQRGDDLPEGAYFYVFVVKYDDGTSEQIKGHLTILRE